MHGNVRASKHKRGGKERSHGTPENNANRARRLILLKTRKIKKKGKQKRMRSTTSDYINPKTLPRDIQREEVGKRKKQESLLRRKGQN